MSTGPPPRRDGLSLTGWLYADLLLALAMIFLAASTVGMASPDTSGSRRSLAPSQGGAVPSPVTSPTPPPAGPSAQPGPSGSLTTEPWATASTGPIEGASPTPTETCVPSVSLERTSVFVGPGGSRRPPTGAQLEQALRPYRGRTAGLIQAYGFTPRARPESGKQYAQVAIDRLRKAVPEMFTPETVTETYHYLRETDTGRVQLAVYFLEQSCH